MFRKGFGVAQSVCRPTLAHVVSHSICNGVKRPEGETDSSRQSNATVRMRGVLHFLLHFHANVFK
jgi:hypothetical protein